MKKKFLLMLPCIVAVAIATFVGKKTFESSALERNNIMLENVEALSQGDAGGFFVPCYQSTTTCTYNATNANGETWVMVIPDAVKAAPYK